MRVVYLADIRFPLERANGVQIVKTAAALGSAGARTTLLVRQSDPRPTPEILALYGVASHPGLRVRRLRVLHRRGAFAVARASFLARAALFALPALRRGAAVLTRDLQLADVLLRLPGRPRVVYEAPERFITTKSGGAGEHVRIHVDYDFIGPAGDLVTATVASRDECHPAGVSAGRGASRGEPAGTGEDRMGHGR